MCLLEELSKVDKAVQEVSDTNKDQTIRIMGEDRGTGLNSLTRKNRGETKYREGRRPRINLERSDLTVTHIIINLSSAEYKEKLLKRACEDVNEFVEKP